MKTSSKILFSLCLLFSMFAQAQAVDVTEEGDTKEANKYFDGRKAKKSPEKSASRDNTAGADPHYLALHLGAFIEDQAYRWGAGDQHKIGNLNIGVTYRMGEWVNTADFMLRAEYSSYSLEEGDARKLNLLGMLMFPDSHSHFPLYFGVGVGPGFYLKQIHGHSAMSLDYQAVVGARFLNLFDNFGLLAEFGLKNDIQLFSIGQFNGLFAGVGGVWVF